LSQPSRDIHFPAGKVYPFIKTKGDRMSKKTYNIYFIDDEKVKTAMRHLGSSIKYLLEVDNRKRNKYVTHRDPFCHYHHYLNAFDSLAETFIHRVAYTPSKFLEGLMVPVDVSTIDDIVDEFLQLVAIYMSIKTGRDADIVFLPFYTESSYENFYFMDEVKKKYFEWLKEKPIDEWRYSKDELEEMVMRASVKYKDLVSNPGIKTEEVTHECNSSTKKS